MGVFRLCTTHQRVPQVERALRGCDGVAALTTYEIPDDHNPGVASCCWEFPMACFKRVEAALLSTNVLHRGRWGQVIDSVPAATVRALVEAAEVSPPDEVRARMERLPGVLRRALYHFQEEGVRFGLARGGRCLIADQMGVGKTLQAIAISSCFLDEGPLLVVVPASLRLTWAQELERWLPQLQPRHLHIIFGSADKFSLLHLAREFPYAGAAAGARVAAAGAGDAPVQVVITSFHMLSLLSREVHAVRWGSVVVDESHTLRATCNKQEVAMTSNTISIVKRTRRAVLMTGTPSLSRPFDIFHQVDALKPGILGEALNTIYIYVNM